MSHLLAQAATAIQEHWRLQTDWVFAPWVTVVLIVGSVALVAYCYAREATPAGAGYRALLAGLRLAVVALLLVMLTQLLLLGTRSGRPHLAWVLDRSGSMSVADAGVDGASTRIDAAKQALLTSDANLLRQVGERYDLEVITVDNDQESLAGTNDDLRSIIKNLAADESSPTRLGDALHQLLERPASPTPQAVVVVTDGQNSVGRSLASAAEAARRAGAPVYFLGVGGKEGPPDVSLTDALADEAVFVDDIVAIGATLRSQGVDGTIRVTLRREGSPDVLAEERVAAPTAGVAIPIQLLHRPDSAGEFRYLLTAESAGEHDTENNTVSADVNVRDSAIRVLLAAGYPMYEYRYLKHLLERDSTVQLTTYLQESDLEYATADRTAISRFPNRRRDLDEYDVVMLMDLDPELLPRSLWGELREWVASDGGGLALIAGERRLPRDYHQIEAMRALSPAVLTGREAALIDNGGFRLSPTDIGARSPAFQLGDSPSASLSIWRGLTPLYWCMEIAQPKPTAQVLAVHPSATDQDGRPLPLVLTQFFGAGHVLMHAVDATYRWRMRTGDAYFARYWVQSLRRLARGRLTRDQQGWRLTVDRTSYAPGEPVQVRLRAPGRPDEASVLLKPASGPERQIRLTPSPAGRTLEATLESLPVGRHRVLLTGAPPGVETPSAAFEVTQPPGEFAKLAINTQGMRSAAQRTGGAFLTIEEADELLGALPPAQPVNIESLPPVELWNRWWMLAGICTCLISEWILRKRKAML